MNDNKEAMKSWIEENLISSSDAHIFTGQKYNSFKTAISRGKVKPFVILKHEDSKGRATSLFLKEDLENYKKHIDIKKNLK